MAQNKIKWPEIVLPAKRGDINVSDVLAIPPGAERDKMIGSWCVSVWNAYKDNKEIIKDLAEQL